MPRRRTTVGPLDEPEVVDELPPRGGGGSSWYPILMTVLRHPGVWCKIGVLETDRQASGVQSNLASRGIRIPNADADWQFAARGNEVFAKYSPNPKPKKQKKGASRGGIRGAK